MMTDYILSLDIGGTACKLAIVAATGRQFKELLFPSEFSFQQPYELNPLLMQIDSYLPSYIRILESQDFSLEQLSAVAISATGQIDSHRGVVAGSCGNFPGWLGTDLRHYVQERFQLPCTVINDANAMLLGEYWLGGLQSYHSIVGVTLGTGVGGAVISEGHLLLGQRGLAAELGHVAIAAPERRRCSCGLFNCAEQYCSSSALVRQAQNAGLPYDNARDICADLFASGSEPSAALSAVWQEWLGYLALALVNYIHIFNPDCIVIGGGISEQGERLLRPLREILARLVMPEFWRHLTLSVAKMGNRAALLGAAYQHLTNRQ